MSTFKKPNTALRCERGDGDHSRFENKTMSGSLLSLPGKMKIEPKVKSGVNHTLRSRFQGELLANKSQSLINLARANNCQDPVVASTPLALARRCRSRSPSPVPSKKPFLDNRVGKPLVQLQQPNLQLKQPPKKIPADPATLVRLKFSRCARSTLLLNNARQEKRLAIDVRENQIFEGIMEITRKKQHRLFLLGLRNKEIQKLTSEIQDADFLQQLYRATAELSDKEDAVGALHATVASGLNILPVRNCKIHEPIPIGAVKNRVQAVNQKICSRHGTCTAAVKTGEYLTMVADAQQRSTSQMIRLEKLQIKLKILKSMNDPGKMDEIIKYMSGLQVSGSKNSSDEDEESESMSSKNVQRLVEDPTMSLTVATLTGEDDSLRADETSTDSTLEGSRDEDRLTIALNIWNILTKD